MAKIPFVLQLITVHGAVLAAGILDFGILFEVTKDSCKKKKHLQLDHWDYRLQAIDRNQGTPLENRMNEPFMRLTAFTREGSNKLKMDIDSINVGVAENTRACRIRQTAAVSNPVIGSQNCNKRVHFAATEASCDGPESLSEDESLDSVEEAHRRSQIWYTEKDYENFQNDRVATIRLFRSLKGDTDEVLEDFYCLRGLEPFHSPSLQSELCVHRAIYVNAVLSEQRRAILQKIRKQLLCNDEEDDGSCLADAIRQRIEHVSKWSMQRAQRLAVLDQMEAQKINGGYNRRRSSWAPMQEFKRRRCDGIPFLLQGTDGKKSFLAASQANLLELKEMNRRLVQEMGASGLGVLQRPESPKNSLPETDMMSLNSLMHASIIKTKCAALLPPLPMDFLQQDLSTISNLEIQTARNA